MREHATGCARRGPSGIEAKSAAPASHGGICGGRGLRIAEIAPFHRRWRLAGGVGEGRGHGVALMVGACGVRGGRRARGRRGHGGRGHFGGRGRKERMTRAGAMGWGARVGRAGNTRRGGVLRDGEGGAEERGITSHEAWAGGAGARGAVDALLAFLIGVEIYATKRHLGSILTIDVQ
jgi:hypothetical protein